MSGRRVQAIKAALGAYFAFMRFAIVMSASKSSLHISFVNSDNS